MLFKGTERRPEPQLISGPIESVGGILNASTDREVTVYHAYLSDAGRHDRIKQSFCTQTSTTMQPLAKWR